MRKILSLLFAALLPLAGFAAAPVYQSNGICRFILCDYNLSAENEAKIDLIVADLLKRHEEVFNFTNSNLRINIRLFGRFDDYAQFAKTNFQGFGSAQLNQNISNLAGYYSYHDKEVVTWRQRDPTYLANNILHECSHAIMHQQFRVLPIWLDEGCAVYFSFPAFMRSAGAQERLKYQWFVLKKWLDEKSLPNLRTFLNLPPDQFRAEDPDRTYPISWSLFQLLASTPENRAAMNKMILDFQNQNPFDHDCAELMDKYYPGGVAKLEKDWHLWIIHGAANVLGTKSP
ncbi:MAG TPA: hypothetical protein VFV23_02670 [Verrucomicrobiae bacterium]|nr:hypothetical protein [Verrucomicrobiae bacterium]